MHGSKASESQAWVEPNPTSGSALTPLWSLVNFQETMHCCGQPVLVDPHAKAGSSCNVFSPQVRTHSCNSKQQASQRLRGEKKRCKSVGTAVPHCPSPSTSRQLRFLYLVLGITSYFWITHCSLHHLDPWWEREPGCTDDGVEKRGPCFKEGGAKTDAKSHFCHSLLLCILPHRSKLLR